MLPRTARLLRIFSERRQPHTGRRPERRYVIRWEVVDTEYQIDSLPLDLAFQVWFMLMHVKGGLPGMTVWPMRSSLSPACFGSWRKEWNVGQVELTDLVNSREIGSWQILNMVAKS